MESFVIFYSQLRDKLTKAAGNDSLMAIRRKIFIDGGYQDSHTIPVIRLMLFQHVQDFITALQKLVRSIPFSPLAYQPFNAKAFQGMPT